jgi:hypothetical protein
MTRFFMKKTLIILVLFPILISFNSYGLDLIIPDDIIVCVKTSEEHYKDNIKDGVIYFKEGEEVGKWTYWYENGRIKAEGNYKDYKRDGKVIAWFENDQIEKEATFKDDKCISGDC